MEIARILFSQWQDRFIYNSCIYSLLQLAEEVCSDPEINTTDFTTSDVDIVGPAIYLIKLLVRQYGFPCLKHVFKEHKWTVPEGLLMTDQV